MRAAVSSSGTLRHLLVENAPDPMPQGPFAMCGETVDMEVGKGTPTGIREMTLCTRCLDRYTQRLVEGTESGRKIDKRIAAARGSLPMRLALKPLSALGNQLFRRKRRRLP